MLPHGEVYLQESHLIYRIVNDEALVVNGITNKWYRLNSVGALILERLKSPGTLGDLCDTISTELSIDEITPEELRTDTEEFLQYLYDERIVRPASQAPSPKGHLRVDDWRDEMDSTGIELMIPTWAKIEVSTACHLECAHCYIP